MNVFAKFDEIPSMILEVINETKCYGYTDGRSDNVKTVFPPTNKVCGGGGAGGGVIITVMLLNFGHPLSLMYTIKNSN